jgi:hypothetical protein
MVMREAATSRRRRCRRLVFPVTAARPRPRCCSACNQRSGDARAMAAGLWRRGDAGELSPALRAVRLRTDGGAQRAGRLSDAPLPGRRRSS